MHQRRSAYFPAPVCRDPGSAALRGRTPVPRARGTAVRRVVLCLKCRLVDERGSHEVPLPTWPLSIPEKSIIKVARIIEPIFIEDESIGKGTDFQKPVPIRRVAG